MKILIMGFGKIKFMPYMNFYLDNINKEKHDVHILYWNRDLQEEETSHLNNVTLHEFRCYQEDDVSKLSKISSFLKYRKFALSLLKKEKFDYLFVLHSLTGVVIYDYLKKNFKNKFVFDYRDSTYEALPPFKKAVAGLVKNSTVTFVSSDAFRKFLPEEEKEKIFTSHNILADSLNHRDDKELFGTKSDKIRVAFWGFIRHEEINLQLIKQFGADSRFELHYYGREQQIAENLKAYVKENNITNVFFHGEYKPEDRYEFIKNTDLIHNIYYDSNTLLAMGNKYYDGIIFRIPQLCTKGSFMGELCEKNSIGFQCDAYSEDFTQKVYEYYKNINMLTFKENCNKELVRVYDEYNKGSEMINNI